MYRYQVEAVLRPIWIGFAAAEERLEAMLCRSTANPLTRGNAAQGLLHESGSRRPWPTLDRNRAMAFRRDGLRLRPWTPAASCCGRMFIRGRAGP